MENANREIIPLLKKLSWPCGYDMYEDPRGLGEEYAGGRIWRKIYALFQILTVPDNTQRESLSQAKEIIHCLISKVDLSQIYNVPGMEIRKTERRTFIACNFAYHLLVAYGTICRRLLLIDEANTFFTFALKLDLIKEGWYRSYKKTMEQVEEDNAGCVVFLKLTSALRSQLTGKEIKVLSPYDDFLQDFFKDTHNKEERYTRKTIVKFDLPTNLLRFATTELAATELEKKNYELVKMILSEYEVDVQKLTKPFLTQLEKIRSKASGFSYALRDSSPLIKIAIRIPGIFPAAKELAKMYILQECDTHLKIYNNSPTEIKEIAKIYRLDDFLLDRITLVFKREIKTYHEDTGLLHEEIIKKIKDRLIKDDIRVVNIYSERASQEDKLASAIKSLLKNYELTIDEIERR